MTERPILDETLSEEEFVRWYWSMAELQPFARDLGVRAAGPKAELTDRIAAKLGSRLPRPVAKRVASGDQIAEPLTPTTRIPAGQRSSEALRSFFTAEIGPSFTFNGHMRSFLLEGGATLGEAIDHWHQTVGTPLPKQSESLEFNRFMKTWHANNPDGSAAECRQAWAAHRALPVDER
ncbi:MAG: DUF6434 domain-containing protein [Acidimicrobiales bacterium]